MARSNRLTLCIAGTLATGCALPGMTADYDAGITGVAGANGGGTHAGGSGPIGGSANAGGASNLGGGMSNAGGSSSAGGAISAGGSSQQGGTKSAGGSSTVGGASTPGGSVSIGGAITAGGATGTGGVTATGGLASTGGNRPTGGAANVGGATSTGGVPSTGGAKPTGGTTSTGGVPSTGGSSSNMPTATAVSAGWGHTCALINDGSMRCWGNDCNGELGDGVVNPDCSVTNVISAKPVKVLNITQATAIAAGGYHTCAIITNGGVKCWGYNGYGQLGDGTQSDSSVPVDVFGISSATAIVAGTYHTCAILADSSVRCWGENSSYELGNGGSADSPIPVTVQTDHANPPSLLKQVTSIASNTYTRTGTHTCAMVSGGTMYCWGPDGYGQLGDQTTIDSDIALRVAGIQAASISAGNSQSCAMLSDGSVHCWGYGGLGDLGDGKGVDSLAPVVASLMARASALASGGDHSCVILANSNSTVQCWGYNYYGQVGDGTSGINRLSPVDVKTLAQVKSISGGSTHTCAIVAGGAVYCWGDSTFGQLGTGITSLSTIPGLVSGF